MPLAGHQLLPRDAARLLHNHGWVTDTNLVRMLCTIMAESDLYDHAWHWNDPAVGGNGSTDHGLFQLNDGNVGGKSPTVGPDGLPVNDPKVAEFAAMAYDPDRAAAYAREMYLQRGFQPWVAYNNGAWRKFGPKATHGVMNMLNVIFGWPVV